MNTHEHSAVEQKHCIPNIINPYISHRSVFPMASAMSTMSKPFKKMLLSALIAAVVVSGFQFEVGEHIGWKKPAGDEPETYNEWAAKNRFRIGDSLHFTYLKDDSVLEVSSADYLKCNASNPISKFDGGSTVFRFDRSGFFYFISGEDGHCKEGQRLIVRVMHPSEGKAPETAPSLSPSPSPASGGGDGGGGSDNWGPPGVNSTTKLSAVSHLMTALVGLFFLLYMFM